MGRQKLAASNSPSFNRGLHSYENFYNDMKAAFEKMKKVYPGAIILERREEKKDANTDVYYVAYGQDADVVAECLEGVNVDELNHAVYVEYTDLEELFKRLIAKMKRVVII